MTFSLPLFPVAGRLRSLLAVLAATFVVLLLPSARAAETLPPKPTAYFNDYAGLVDSGTAAQINRALQQFERETSDQLLVAVFPSMQSDSSIEDYTVRVAQSWHAGQKGRDNGAILFVFVKNHTMYIQVGYGLEPVLTDALAQQIIDGVIKPHFRAGDYAGGLAAGVNAMMQAVRGEFKGTGRTHADGSTSLSGLGNFVFLMFVVFGLLGSIFRRRARPHVYTGSGSGLGGPWIWPGGFGGGGGGGGGFGGGGFSGGGGSFGGGGAGGSW